MITKAGDLLRLRGADLEVAARTLDADPDLREQVDGYQGLADLDVVDAPDGVRIFLRGDDVVLIYVGPDALPAGLDGETLGSAVGADGDLLRSRQGKRANLHVVAGQGIAWSEDAGQIGFVELFPPTTLEGYRRDIYLEPAKFIR